MDKHYVNVDIDYMDEYQTLDYLESLDNESLIDLVFYHKNRNREAQLNNLFIGLFFGFLLGAVLVILMK